MAEQTIHYPIKEKILPCAKYGCEFGDMPSVIDRYNNVLPPILKKVTRHESI